MAISTEDRLAIHELIALHGHLMDRGEFDRLDELFSPDVTYDLDDFGLDMLEGIAAIRESAVTMGDRNPVGHHVTNILVSAAPDGTIGVRSKAIGIYVDGSAGSVEYDDVVRREESGWRICYRRVLLRRSPLNGRF